MKRVELMSLLVFLSNAYPRKFNFPKRNKKDNKEFIETWYDFLKEFEYSTVEKAFKKLIIRKSEWPPTLGEVVKEIKRYEMRIF